jgi:hypothetical protein
MVTISTHKSRGELSSARGPGGVLTRPDLTYHAVAWIRPMGPPGFARTHMSWNAFTLS